MNERRRNRLLAEQREHDRLAEQNRAALEGQKLALDMDKLALEREKFALERNKLDISLYLEDFKARWQELLNFENENNRWTTLYVTALLLVIGWILNNVGKYGGLGGLYAQADNAYFILSIAVVNALYTFAMAFKGYQIQQIAQYQYEFLGERIWQLTHTPFNEWERYRRETFASKRGPEPIRTAYFFLISSLPTIVSYTIIVMYWGFQWQAQADMHHWRSARNWFSVLAFFLVNCSLLLSVLTSRLNSRWVRILERTSERLIPAQTPREREDG